MLKFIRGKGHTPTPERLQKIEELFAFSKCVQQGFPSKPSCLAWDPVLRLLAIGTRTGTVRVFGGPGVEFSGEHKSELSVTKLVFLPNQARLVSLCEDNSLHLWEINGEEIEEKKSTSLEGKLKQISTICLDSSSNTLLIGTEGGNVYLLNLSTFEMSENIIYQDVALQNVPDVKTPGPVEAICLQPENPDKVLIGYDRGQVILYDRVTPNVDQTFVGHQQQLMSMCWHPSGKKFMTSHNDGSYVIWSTDNATNPESGPDTPYGPFACKSIQKIDWFVCDNGEYIIFSGGMPRASYGDKYTVTVKHGEKQVAFDLTSKIVDFLTITDGEQDTPTPTAVVILAEEELVVLDLTSENWPSFRLPYLASLHSSAVTCSHHISDVPKDFIENVREAGKKQNHDKYSTKDWPINGGTNDSGECTDSELLITGHEDGTVRFWDANGTALTPLYTFSTSVMFTGEEINDGMAADEEEWPPFNKVGCFDPFSDDPRLAVKKLSLCPLTGTLVVAGTAGQIIVCRMELEEVEKKLEPVLLNIVSDRDGFVWKGHEKLTLKEDPVTFTAGMQPFCLVQLHPPAACTALALHSEWSLVAAGTAHGLGLVDYRQQKEVITKCTLNPNDMGAGDTPMSRRKSFKKSLRESFRRLRKGRAQRQEKRKKDEDKDAKKDSGSQAKTEEGKTDAPAEASKTEEKSEVKESETEKKGAPTDPQQSPKSPVAAAATPTTTPAKSIERQVEARSADDSMGSMVRCLYLTKSFIVSVQAMTPTLWAGTNNGAIFVFTIKVPMEEKREEEPVICQLGKEIQLKHCAPVIAIHVIDGSNLPLPGPLEVEKGVSEAPNVTAPHRVVICSEEQFKVFTLPALKPFGKYKMTALEGSRIRKVGFCHFVSKASENYSETCLVCLTNQGDLAVFTVPDLRRQILAQCTRRDDINGMLSLVFTKNGEILYLHSSSEFQRVTLSTVRKTRPRCHINLPEGMRPEPEVTKEPEKEEQQETKDAAPQENGVKEEDKSPETTDVKERAGESDSKVLAEVPEKETPKENGTEEEKHDLSAADITIDSVKDHLETSTVENKVLESKSERIETSSHTQETVTVLKTTTITSSETVVVGAQDTHATNGDQTETRAAITEQQ